MPEFKRVRFESGAEATVAEVLDGMTVLEDQPAVDARGVALSATYPDKSAKKSSAEAKKESR